jgi:hypothetical protein
VGLSDTFTGAFWVADALFAFANAGANGFHLHWGKGGDLNGDSQPNTGVQTNFEKVSMRCRQLWGPAAGQQQAPADVPVLCSTSLLMINQCTVHALRGRT